MTEPEPNLKMEGTGKAWTKKMQVILIPDHSFWHSQVISTDL